MATIPVVNIGDKRKGIIASLLVLLLLIIYLFLTTFEMADPPPKDVVVHAETIIDEIVLKELKMEGGSGGGTPSDAPIAEPKPQVEKVLTKKKNPDTKVTTGQSNQTNTNTTSQETQSTTQQSTDPFASGGSQGGSGGGDGSTFGQDSGNGSGGGTGHGSGKGRKALNAPDISDLQSNVDALIVMTLTIDAEGNIVGATLVKALTTTSDQILINKVLSAVKKQVKFNKDAGSPLVQARYSVTVNAR